MAGRRWFPNQGVAGNRTGTAEPPAETGRRTWRRDATTAIYEKLGLANRHSGGSV
jgi:hypothetical protein